MDIQEKPNAICLNSSSPSLEFQASGCVELVILIFVQKMFWHNFAGTIHCFRCNNLCGATDFRPEETNYQLSRGGSRGGEGGCPGRHRPVCECTWCTGHAGSNWNAFRIKSIKVSKKYLKREWPKFIPWVDRVKLQWNKSFPKISRKMGKVDRSMSKLQRVHVSVKVDCKLIIQRQ